MAKPQHGCMAGQLHSQRNQTGSKECVKRLEYTIIIHIDTAAQPQVRLQNGYLMTFRNKTRVDESLDLISHKYGNWHRHITPSLERSNDSHCGISSSLRIVLISAQELRRKDFHEHHQINMVTHAFLRCLSS